MEVLNFSLPVTYSESVTVQEDDLPHFYPYLHRHPELQLTWILEGEGTLVIDTSMHSFSAGDIFLLGANQPHLFKSNPEYFTAGSKQRVRCMMVHFDPQGALSGAFDLPEMHVLRTFIEHHYNGFRIPSRYVKLVSEKMQEMQLAVGFDRLVSCFKLLKILYSMDVHVQPLCVTSVEDVSEHDGIRISIIYLYIMKNYTRIITLDEIAATANMTTQAFCRYFKQHTGSTFGMFLNEIRINEACKKLTTGNCEKISAVAYESGFNTVSNFNRIFKNVLGVTPRNYLKKYTSNFN